MIEMRIRYNHVIAALIFIATFVIGVEPTSSSPAQSAHPIAAVKVFIQSLPTALRKDLIRPFSHQERFNFGWVPGTR
ncbi:MAG: hypothetical protein ACKVHL_07820, partial [Rhodospirillales bacterium]